MNDGKKIHGLESIYLQRLEGTKKQGVAKKKKPTKDHHNMSSRRTIDNYMNNNNLSREEGVDIDNEDSISDFDHFDNYLESMKK